MLLDRLVGIASSPTLVPLKYLIFDSHSCVPFRINYSNFDDYLTFPLPPSSDFNNISAPHGLQNK